MGSSLKGPWKVLIRSSSSNWHKMPLVSVRMSTANAVTIWPVAARASDHVFAFIALGEPSLGHQGAFFGPLRNLLWAINEPFKIPEMISFKRSSPCKGYFLSSAPCCGDIFWFTCASIGERKLGEDLRFLGLRCRDTGGALCTK